MWIVQLALRRPYTFVVLALLIFVFGPVTIRKTPTDIFPNINIPVVAVTFQYTGLNPEEIEGRVTTPYEKFLTSLVDNIEHLESTSYNGECVIKIFLQPGASLDTANAQITAVSQQILRVLPPGTLPPEIINFSASTVPVLQIGVSGKGLDEQQLNDLSNNFVRPTLITVPGAVVPLPYGGKQAQITVAMNLATMQSKGVSPSDLVAAMNAQNVIGPIGTAKIGMKEYDIRSNAAPRTIDELSNMPIKQVNGATIYIRDVATVSNGSAFQTNIVRRDGRRGVLMTILKGGSASTINVVKGIRDLLPRVAQTVPPEMQMSPIGDQSVFVRSAVAGVVREALIAGCLTAFMVLTFLGSWRSTFIIATSIPLSILTSIIAFSALGETINMMTLAGLALSVGILVDDATVEVENINRNRELEPETKMDEVVLHSAAQIATPAFVSTLSICIVFAPMFLLTGVARYLFIPLAEAVVFALLSSYFFSRTIVPTMAKYLLRKERSRGKGEVAGNSLIYLQRAFERGFGRVRDLYRVLLTRIVLRRRVFIVIFLLACMSACLLIPFLGKDFFPSTDSGAFILHVRGDTGDRIEETAKLSDLVERSIRRTIPSSELNNILDNIGVPYSNTNIMHMTSGAFGSADSDITVTLNNKHRPTADYIRELRARLPREFPGVTFYFLPADMTTQVLNFGLPSPIDVQLESNDVEASTQVADEWLPQLKQVPGLTDIRIQQPLDYPTLNIDIDRTKALQGGFTARDIADSMLNSLSGSYQVSPMYFLNWKNGVSYSFVAQTQQYGVSSLQDIENIPISSSTVSQRATPELLSDLSSIHRDREKAVISHYNVRRVIDIYGAVQDRDLGAVSRDVQRIVDARSGHLPRGMFVSVKGQAATMRSSYRNLLEGLCVAILLVYALIVVNFQSWLDPFIIVMALPAALAGIVMMLFLTHTTLSVPALMGAIMSMGVATSNSILVIQFAKERLAEHGDAPTAAIEAGVTRFRPVCMTALAMIIGMVPMAFGMGSGGEQNAPLGRAVIGGLLCATVATLIFVPSVFALLHAYWRKRAEGHEPSVRDTQSA